MWKNRGSNQKNHSGFTNRRQHEQFGRSDQEFNRGLNRQDQNWTGYEDCQAVADRNTRRESNEYGRSEDRFGRLEVENIRGSITDNSDRYQGIQPASFSGTAEYTDNYQFREQPLDLRHVLDDSRQYTETDARGDLDDSRLYGGADTRGVLNDLRQYGDVDTRGVLHGDDSRPYGSSDARGGDLQHNHQRELGMGDPQNRENNLRYDYCHGNRDKRDQEGNLNIYGNRESRGQGGNNAGRYDSVSHVRESLGQYDNRKTRGQEDDSVNMYDNREALCQESNMSVLHDPRGSIVESLGRYDDRNQMGQDGWNNRDFRNEMSSIGIADHLERQDRDSRGNYHQHDVSGGNDLERSGNFTGQVTGNNRRESRQEWKVERFGGKKNFLKGTHTRNKGLNITSRDKRPSVRSIGKEALGSGLRSRLNSAKGNGSNDNSNRRSKSSTSSKAKVSDTNAKQSESGSRSGHRSETDSKRDYKKSGDNQKVNQSTSNQTNTPIKDRSSKHSATSSGNTQGKTTSDYKPESTHSKGKSGGDVSNQGSTSSRTDGASFKKPIERSSRYRGKSGRKPETDTGHFHDEDILSIMADDDGFEREMNADSSSATNCSRNQRRSRELQSRGKATEMERNTSSRQSSRDGENRNRQTAVTITLDDQQTSTKLHGEISSTKLTAESSSSVNRSSEIRSPSRRDGENRGTRNSASGNKFSIPLNKQFRVEEGNRNVRRQGGNDATISTGSKSRFTLASKIRDSYRRNRPISKFPINNYSKSVSQKSHVRKDIGTKGTVLIDDRIKPTAVKNRDTNVRNKDSGESIYGRNRNSGVRNLDKARSVDVRNKDTTRSAGVTNRNNNIRNRNKSGSVGARNIVKSRLSGNKNRDSSRLSDDRNRDINRSNDRHSSTYQQHITRNTRVQEDRAKNSLAHHERVKRKYFSSGFGRHTAARHSSTKRDYDKQGDKRNIQLNKSSQNGRYGNNSSTKDEEVIQDSLQPVDMPLDANQQVIFIQNPELHTGPSHMVDQFGQVILNPNIGTCMQEGEGQVPIQFLPQQFADGMPAGEQVVFIPFVNNQVPPFPENVSLAFDNNNMNTIGESPAVVHSIDAAPSVNASVPIRKPLSKAARMKLRKTLATKRKLRMEMQIEQRLLKKLLGNASVAQAARESECNEVKKKSIFKRISPPSATVPSHIDKKYKLVRKGNRRNAFEDVSDDEHGNRYDNVSDFDDVSDFEGMEGNEEYESRHGKRPVFRKPGQPRVAKKLVETPNRARSGSTIQSTTGDIRRVIDQSAHQQVDRNVNQQSRLSQFNVKPISNLTEKSRRSVFVEASDVAVKHTNPVTGQKRTSENFKFEHKKVKRERSVSPIEITVDNDRYTKATTGKSTLEDNYDSRRKRTTEAYNKNGRYEERKSDSRHRHSDGEQSEGRYDRTKNVRNDEYGRGNNDTYNRGNRENVGQFDKVTDRTESRNSDKNRDHLEISCEMYADGNKNRNYHSIVDIDERPGRREYSTYRDKEGRATGKYENKVESRINNRIDRNEDSKERTRNEREDRRDRREEHFNKNDGNYSDNRKESHQLDRKRNELQNRDSDSKRGEDLKHSRGDKDDKTKDRSHERSRHERKGSPRRDRNSHDSHAGRKNEGNIGTNIKQDTNRNVASNTFVSSVNQGQFQISQPVMQHQPFMSAQSQSIPIQGQPVLQFSRSGNVIDHSLPPVQNTPISMPSFPSSNLGVQPDMSLPPPMNVVGTPTSLSTMVIQQSPGQQQPNNVHFQHQVNVQQQMQQSQQHQFRGIQPQFQHQQFQQIPQQMMQQSNQQQFHTQQPMYQTSSNNVPSNRAIPLQQMQSNQFQQTQSNVGIMSVNRDLMHGQVTQTGSMNVGQVTGTSQQSFPTSGKQTSYVAATPQQAVRGVIGTLKQTGDGSNTVVRAQPVRIAAQLQPVNQSRVSKPGTMSMRPKQYDARLNSFDKGQVDSLRSRYPDDDENDDELPEMLCSKCDKVYLSHEVMRRHGRWHDLIESNTKNWRCDQCEQGFATSSDHSEHMSTKHMKDSWNCSVCDMTFNNSSSLIRHVRQTSHKDLKVKFVCSLCPASFMVLMHLTQHKKDYHQSNYMYSDSRKY